MILFVTAFALANCFAGRGWVPFDRLIGRCLLPTLITYLYTFNLIPTLIVLVGSALWFPWGYSFAEQTGEHDENKYHKWIQKIGTWCFPIDSTIKTNKYRGVIMKGLRGMYDVTPILLGGWYYYPLTFFMGFIYWGVSAIIPTRYSRFEVAVAEMLWGAIRGLIIFLCL